MCPDRLIRLAGAAALALATLPLGACALPQAGPYGPGDAAAPRGALVTVENQHVLDMRVYLVRGSAPVALGSVGSMERRTFVLNTAMIGLGGTIRLLADPLGSRERFVSEPIPAESGDHVRWTLAPSLPLSRLSVWPIGGGV